MSAYTTLMIATGALVIAAGPVRIVRASDSEPSVVHGAGEVATATKNHAKSAARATGRTVKRGAKAVARGTGHVIKKTGEVTEGAGESLEKAGQ